MRKMQAGAAVCKGESVQYYLLICESENELESYGVEVEFQGEHTLIPEITPLYSRVEELLEMLRDGCVTPITAREIVEDWLLGFSCNF